MLGRYELRYLRTSLLWGYLRVPVAPGQEAFLATPGKALLDLIYLEPGADSQAYLEELRLQNLETLDAVVPLRQAADFGKPKLRRAVEILLRLAASDSRQWVTL